MIPPGERGLHQYRCVGEAIPAVAQVPNIISQVPGTAESFHSCCPRLASFGLTYHALPLGSPTRVDESLHEMVNLLLHLG